MPRLGLRFVALFYLGAILIAPLAIVFYRTFENGLTPVWVVLSTPDTIHAFKLTLLITAIAVPLNTVFGIICALAIVRRRFHGKGLLNAFIDLPLALSPVVVGLSLFLLFGRTGWFGDFLARHEIQVLFALPVMVVATIFVSLPFVAREVVPTLREIGDDQEQAARTLGASGWQTFWRITLPNVKWGLLYGVILCNARAMGEFGAVSVVSGHIRGATNTLPLQAEILYNEYQFSAAFAVASLLALLALVTLALKLIVERNTHSRQNSLEQVP